MPKPETQTQICDSKIPFFPLSLNTQQSLAMFSAGQSRSQQEPGLEPGLVCHGHSMMGHLPSLVHSLYLMWTVCQVVCSMLENAS